MIRRHSATSIVRIERYNLAVKQPIIICIAILACAVALTARPEPQDEQGERVLNQSCTNCHDIRRIQTKAMDRDEWNETVKKMIGNGAKVNEGDVPALLDYLVAHHGPVPDGPGKEILLNTCTLCHDLKRVKEHGGTRQDWEETLGAMLNEGAPLSDEEFPVILAYLTRNFRPVR